MPYFKHDIGNWSGDALTLLYWLVRNAKSEEGTKINNAGPLAQITYLCVECGMSLKDIKAECGMS